MSKANFIERVSPAILEALPSELGPRESDVVLMVVPCMDSRSLGRSEALNQTGRSVCQVVAQGGVDSLVFPLCGLQGPKQLLRLYSQQ